MVLAEKQEVSVKPDLSPLREMSRVKGELERLNLKNLGKLSPEECRAEVCTALESALKIYANKKWERTVGQLQEVIDSFEAGQISLDDLLKATGLVQETPPNKKRTLFGRK